MINYETIELEKLQYMLAGASDVKKKEIERVILQKKITFCVGKEISFKEFRSDLNITGTITGVKKSYNDGNYYCVVAVDNNKNKLKNLNKCYEILRNKNHS